MNYPQQGYPQQPPQKPGLSGLAIFGIIAVLFITVAGGGCVICVAVGAKGAKEANKKASAARGELLTGLAQLSANPKARIPKTAKEEKDVARYTYDAPPSWGVRNLEMTVPRDRPNAWRFSFDSTGEKFSPNNFSPTEGVTTDKMPDEWFDVTDGPLKGAVVHLRDARAAADVFSAAFFLTTAGSDEPKLARWACDTGRAGIKAITVSDFLHQCRDVVRSKLLLPDSADFDYLGVANEVTTTGECGHAWSSSVEAKNAFGVTIKHAFTCSYTPKKGRVEATIGGR